MWANGRQAAGFERLSECHIGVSDANILIVVGALKPMALGFGGWFFGLMRLLQALARLWVGLVLWVDAIVASFGKVWVGLVLRIGGWFSGLMRLLQAVARFGWGWFRMFRICQNKCDADA